MIEWKEYMVAATLHRAMQSSPTYTVPKETCNGFCDNMHAWEGQLLGSVRGASERNRDILISRFIDNESLTAIGDRHYVNY